MDTINVDMMREIAYWLNMRSLAAMSIVDRAWHTVLSDRRVLLSTRRRCLDVPLGLHVSRYAPDIRMDANMEHWYHLVAIGREVRLICDALPDGHNVLVRLCVPTTRVRKAWNAMELALAELRARMDAWISERDVGGLRGNWKTGALMYSDCHHLSCAPNDLSDLLARYDALDSDDVRQPNKKKRRWRRRRRRILFVKRCGKVFGQFIAYFRESLQLWERYFAVVHRLFPYPHWKFLTAMTTMTTAVDCAARAIDVATGAGESAAGRRKAPRLM